MEVGAQTVTDDHRKLVFAFMRELRRVQSDDPERLEAIIQLLSDEFKVDSAGLGASYYTDVDLFEVFCASLRDREHRSGPEEDEKYKNFVELLEKKGYFKGVEQGTAEYEQRLQKAREKFNQRNNPYEGLTAEQIKTKGNDLMGQAKYKEAIACYTKAIELDSQNAVYFTNRAAAHTHMKDYNNAVIDCERAIILNPTYAKTYSRLGTALFYQEKYSRAVDAFTKACELDPSNTTYKDDLKRAEEKAQSVSLPGRGGTGMPGLPDFYGGGGAGLPDISQFSEMMNNPQFLDTAQRMMQNPQFSSLVTNMASKFTDGGMTPEALSSLGAGMGVREVDEEGNIITPFGKVRKEAIEKLQQEEVYNNPKMAPVIADVQANGFAAFQKYLGDPDVMNLMIKFQKLMFEGGDGN